MTISKEVMALLSFCGGHFVFGHFEGLLCKIENVILKIWNQHPQIDLFQWDDKTYSEMPQHVWISENGSWLLGTSEMSATCEMANSQSFWKARMVHSLSLSQDCKGNDTEKV